LLLSTLLGPIAAGKSVKPMLRSFGLFASIASVQSRSVFSGISITPQDAVKGAVLFGMGDAVAQGLEVEKISDVDMDRAAKAAIIGSFYGGLMLPFVYQFAEQCCPGRSARNIVLKTLISCGLLSTGGNYYSLVIRRLLGPPHFDEESIRDRVLRCLDSVNALIHTVVLDDLKVWPLYDMFCFAVIPPALRPTATAVVSVCWHTYVSMVAHKKPAIAH